MGRETTDRSVPAAPWLTASDPEWVDLGTKAAGGSAGGESGGERGGEALGRCGPDEEHAVEPPETPSPGSGHAARRRRRPAPGGPRSGGPGRRTGGGRGASAGAARRRPGRRGRRGRRPRSTSWRGRRVWTSSRPPAARGPTSRAARTSSHSACSPARNRGARSSASKSRKTTSGGRPARVRSTRWRTASVPMRTGSAGSSPVAASTMATPTPGSRAARSSRTRLTPDRSTLSLVLPHAAQTRGRVAPQAAQPRRRTSPGRTDGPLGHRRLAPLAAGDLAAGGAGQQPGPPLPVEHADRPDAPSAGGRLRGGPQGGDGSLGEEAEARGLAAAVDDFGDRPTGALGGAGRGRAPGRARPAAGRARPA